MKNGGIAIGELSRRTNCNIETVRYYERIGLLPTPARRGRYRLYGGEDVGRLAFVRRSRELGFTLDEVRALLGLAAGGGGPAPRCARSPPRILPRCKQRLRTYRPWNGCSQMQCADVTRAKPRVAL